MVKHTVGRIGNKQRTPVTDVTHDVTDSLCRREARGTGLVKGVTACNGSPPHLFFLFLPFLPLFTTSPFLKERNPLQPVTGPSYRYSTPLQQSVTGSLHPLQGRGSISRPSTKSRKERNGRARFVTRPPPLFVAHFVLSSTTRTGPRCSSPIISSTRFAARSADRRVENLNARFRSIDQNPSYPRFRHQNHEPSSLRYVRINKFASF